MSAKHTPGPWVIDRNRDQRIGTHIRASVPTITGAVKGISVARITVGGGVADDVAGNATLIAAAPDLLAALRECVEALECHTRSDMGDIRSIESGAVETARAAIAKAEGRP